MSVHVQKVNSAFSGAPGPVQGAVSVAQAGISTITKFIVGNPEALQAAAPAFQQAQQQIAQLSAATQQVAASVDGWEGEARNNFDEKSAQIAEALEQLAPIVGQLSEILQRAAEQSIAAADAIADAVRTVLQAIIKFFHIAMQKAAETFGAAMAAWLTWAIGEAAKLLNLIRQIAEQVAAVLDALAGFIDRIKGVVEGIARVIARLADALDVPGKAKDVLETVLGAGKEIGEVLLDAGKGVVEKGKDAAETAWESLEAKNKREGKYHDEDWKERTSDGYEKKPNWKEDIEVKAKVAEGEFGFMRPWDERVEGEKEIADGVTASGFADQSLALLEGEGNIFVSNKGIGAEGAIRSGIDSSMGGEISVLDGHANVNGEVRSMLGGEAEGKVRVDTGGVEAKGGAFAGAKIEGEVGAEVAGVGVTGYGEAWAGVGIEAEGKATWDDGKLTLGGSFGAGLGVGGKLGFEVTLDVGGAVDAIKDAGQAIGDFFGW